MKVTQQPSRLIRLPEVITRTGYGRASIYRKMALGEFPRPVKLGARAIAWPDSVIQDWIEKRIAESKEAA